MFIKINKNCWLVVESKFQQLLISINRLLFNLFNSLIFVYKMIYNIINHYFAEVKG
jgi:hypothetical protein